MTGPQRRTPVVAFKMLCTLLWGRHSSVVWSTQWSCIVRSRPFCEALGTNTTHFRRYCEWLKRNRYLSELEYGHGYVKLTIAPLPVRVPEEAA